MELRHLLQTVSALFAFVCLCCCSTPDMMAEYTLNVTTGKMMPGSTFDNIFVTLIGTERESERTRLISSGEGKMATHSVTTSVSLGSLLFLKLESSPAYKSSHRSWFCSKIVVRTPEEDEILFPCYQWLKTGGSVMLRGGRGTKAFEDFHPQLVDQRKKELVKQKLKYRWEKYAEGMSYIVNIKDPSALPAGVRFSFSRIAQYSHSLENLSNVFKLTNLKEQWKSFEEMKRVPLFRESPISEYVLAHWKDDDFFGYQFLNGLNPFVIQRCTKLPSNLAVTEEMVKPFLAKGSSLTTEMKKGNIFISDYKILDGLPTRVIDGKPLALPAPICLLYINPEKKLLPIAIQLGQRESKESLVFLPSDMDTDWLLAKLFVRHAEFLCTTLATHLQTTHLIPEVFTVSTLRNFPTIHPLHKLLIPHHRNTLHINIFARVRLYGSGKLLTNSSLGAEGQMELIRRGLSQTTYASLCVPEDIASRGLQSIPNFHYRDDALRLWNIINRFVTAVVSYYYPSDRDVSADSELQEWVNEIFHYAFLGKRSSGIPSSFQTVEKLVRFITVVIFTSTARHSVGNHGQFSYIGWIPNNPAVLHQPPPTTKGQSSIEAILRSLPTKYEGTLSMLLVRQLSMKFDDFVPLGNYPEQRFEEPAVLQMIRDFQAELSSLSVAIAKRNLELELPYDNMNPDVIENNISRRLTMAEYKLEVKIDEMQYAGTWDHVSLTLFGNEGQSDRTKVDNFGRDFSSTGTTGTYTIKTSSSLGKLLIVKMEKDPLVSPGEWYCSTIVVTTPEGDVILFPCHRWITRGEEVELRGGRAMKVFEDDHPLLTEQRKKELTSKKSLYQWRTMTEGLPHIISFNDGSNPPAEICLSISRFTELMETQSSIFDELNLKGMFLSTKTWETIEDMTHVLCDKETTVSAYVKEHWKEDNFYGYQFLNGCNPNMIKCCREIPPNFPVTEEMVKPFLETGTSLQMELKKGNIFIYDLKKMDGIRDYNGELLPVTAGLCLFYMNPENKLKPIAIQLHQKPSEQNPIFLPSDTETDWLLAKIFIRNADVIDHESTHHLLCTHFMAEVYAIATLRCFPAIHPLYKLLVPHIQSSIHINMMARSLLLGPNEILSVSSLGYEGVIELMRRTHAETTYSSLCLPENITARGLESVPNFFYRDDGLKVWNIINRFVKAVVEYYYPTDDEVGKDTELQDWISEIFTHGFLGNKATGMPASFHCTEEVIRFVTMVIFTVTAQHSAVNNGQYDYISCLPNGPIVLHKPPPTTKGQSSMKTILETLPNVGVTAKSLVLLWVLGKRYTDFIPLGAYPERFDEPALKQMIKEFQAELSYLSEEITARNSQLEVPYTYLNPTEIENSTSI
uniref:arachidonate 12-lipoxygenase, 12R-type-like isoform X2 n=1 Tax=Solea senegalensis TaxID=28829 RepID=UPI001CD87910|nr:arachidonate 12-lipoxygenase, 12R-type-like isoform X2 [Solea senegalensis]